jgi:hypothetical protein
MEPFPSVMPLVRRVISILQSRAVYLGLVPLLLLIGGVNSLAPAERGAAVRGQQQAYPVDRNFRTVVLILDSCGSSMAFEPSLMPFLSSMTSSALFGHCEACAAKTTFPCIKSIFEGRAATTGSTLQDFSSVASSRVTWPGSLAAIGFRIVAASDHTLNRLYPGAFVDRLDYEALNIPLWKRDEATYKKTWQWLNDSSIDVLIVHVIGTDKIAHEFRVGGPEYRAKYHEADDFVRQVAERLGAADYLYVLSDHGHNRTGGHTYDAVYFARGPLFPKGRRENLAAEDMLFLLSVPYGLTMPHAYEGQIRTDLTLLPPDFRKQFLFQQAQQWGISPETSLETTEKKLNDFISARRAVSLREESMRDLWRLAPWWLAAAFFLLGQLGGTKLLPRFWWFAAALAGLGLIFVFVGIAAWGWLLMLSMLLYCSQSLGILRTAGATVLLCLASMILLWAGANSGWILTRRMQYDPRSYAIFYAVGIGFATTLSLGAAHDSWQVFVERALWNLGLVVWLISYFGPGWGFSLLRQGPIFILGVAPLLALLLARQWRIFGYLSLLSWPILAPFVVFRLEGGWNIDSPFFNRIRQMPMPWQTVLALFLIVILAYAMSFSSHLASTTATRRMSILVRRTALLSAWLLTLVLFFEFPIVRAVVCLVLSIWLAGCLELLRRAGLHWRWTALVGVTMLFITLAFILEGLQLSHVDFRFAGQKIVPFSQELWRAAQLIIWSMIKYAFALLPLLAVLRAHLPRTEMSLDLLQLGWWRQLMIIAIVWTLCFYNRTGLYESCAEEIYFWIFLNLVIWGLCLSLIWLRRATDVDSVRISGHMKTQGVA